MTVDSPRRQASPSRLASPSTLASPCRQVCVLEPKSRVCTGCGRTIDEIARWASLDDPAKHRILVALPERLAALDAQKNKAT